MTPKNQTRITLLGIAIAIAFMASAIITTDQQHKTWQIPTTHDKHSGHLHTPAHSSADDGLSIQDHWWAPLVHMATCAH